MPSLLKPCRFSLNFNCFRVVPHDAYLKVIEARRRFRSISRVTFTFAPGCSLQFQDHASRSRQMILPADHVDLDRNHRNGGAWQARTTVLVLLIRRQHRSVTTRRHRLGSAR